MFESVKTNSSRSIVEIREHLDFIAANTPAAPASVPNFINTSKGLVYVQLYGAIEHTISTTIAECLAYINRESITINDLQPVVLSLVLNSELDGLIQVSRNKWSKRCVLFQRMNNNETVQIQTDLLPTDGKNVHLNQLKMIWETFAILDPLFHDYSFSGRLKDIVSNRVNIAHGNVLASDVGRSVTIGELYSRLNDTSAYCSYFISVFESYVNEKKFKKI